MRISRRAVLLLVGTQLALGLASGVRAEPAAGRRYLIHVSGMT
jgi:hypothetical protein